MPITILPFILLVVPVLEIAVFIIVGGEIGVLATLALILFTAILGTILLRYQGFTIITRIRSEIEKDRIPGRELGDGAMILVAGVLLLTPGFVTDTIGFSLFIPAFRNALWRFIASRVTKVDVQSYYSSHQGNAGNGGRKTIDLEPDEFSRDNEDSPSRKDS
jgi:UPF0716 protein FxsA